MGDGLYGETHVKLGPLGQRLVYWRGLAAHS